MEKRREDASESKPEMPNHDGFMGYGKGGGEFFFLKLPTRLAELKEK